MELHEFNNYILSEYNQLACKDELSKPLLISPNLTYNNDSVLYIGKETNTWYDESDLLKLEQRYYDFMKGNARNRDFWKFIKSMYSVDQIIWNNTFICGKKDSLGLTPYYEDIYQISVEYLVFLYQYFKPRKTIIACGPKNPYYAVIEEFCKQINSSLAGEYPTLSNPLVSDNDLNIYYTYHPKYLKLQHKTNEVLSKITNN